MRFREKGSEQHVHTAPDAFSEGLRSFRMLWIAALLLGPVPSARTPAVQVPPPPPPEHSLGLTLPAFPMPAIEPSRSSHAPLQMAKLPPIGSLQMHRVHLHVGKNKADVRAVVIPSKGPYEVTVILTAEGATRSQLQHLIKSHSFDFITNGTFFGGGVTLGDIVGVSSADPSHRVVRPFAPGRQALEQRIENRFYFAIDGNGQPVIGRATASVRANLSSYRTYLGGIAAVDFEDCVVASAVEDNDREKFIKYFNRTNGVFNGSTAYDGLNGSSRISRTGLGIMRKDGRDIIVSMTAGDGRTRNGLNIFEFTKAFRKLALREGGVPVKFAVLDSGSSTIHASSSSMEKGGRAPTTLIGIRPSPESGERMIAVAPRFAE